VDDLDEGNLKAELEDITKKIDDIIDKVDAYEAEIHKDTTTEGDPSIEEPQKNPEPTFGSGSK